MSSDLFNQAQANPSQKFQPPNALTNGQSSDAYKLLLDQYSRINRSFEYLSAEYFHYSTTRSSLSLLQQQFAFQYAGVNHLNVISAFPTSALRFEARPRARAYRRRPPSFRSLSSQWFQSRPRSKFCLLLGPLRKSLLSALNQIKICLPPNEKRKFEDIVIPQIKQKTKTRLTLSEALALLSILVSIFFGVVSSMPNEQIERIIAQNEIFIKQHAEIAKSREDKDLINALNSLSDSINTLSDQVNQLNKEFGLSDDSTQDALRDSINRLSDEVESLHEELKSSNDTSDEPDQVTHKDTQHQDIDAQN